MEKSAYKYAFTGIEASDAAIDGAVERAYGGKRRTARFGRRGVAVAIALTLLLTLGATAVASRFVTGSFIGFFVDITGSEDMVNDATIDIGQTQVCGNYSVTLDSVVADEQIMYLLYTIKTVDGSPLYPEGIGAAPGGQTGTTSSGGSADSTTVSSAQPGAQGVAVPTEQVRTQDRWDFSAWDDSVSYGTGSNWKRLDDLSDPSSATVLEQVRFNAPINPGVGRATVSIDELYGVVETADGREEFVTLAKGDWSFSFEFNDVMKSLRYELEHDGTAYMFNISPLTLSIMSNNYDEFMHSLFSWGEAERMYIGIELTDGGMVNASNSGAAKAQNSDSGEVYWMSMQCSMERVIDPYEVAALHIDGVRYPVTMQ